MSDLQPRKRKDKKRKRDSLDRRSEGELLFLRKQSLSEDEDIKDHHGVHATKMGPEDVHLHVQSDHGTGGHWCAKVLFFSLLVILLGLVGLIILENRGLSDLDTPLSESRFSEYFDGWVDEHRDSHDDHGVDKVLAELEDHDHDNEPFEEEDTGGDDEGDEDHDAEEADEEHEEVEEQPSEEEDQDEEAEDDQEEPEEEEEDDEEVENNTQEEEPDENDENDATNEADEDQDEEPVHSYRSKRSISEENVDSKDEDDNDEGTDEGFGDADDSNDAENDDNYENDNNDEDNDEDDDSPEIITRSSHQQHSTPPPPKSQEKRRGDIDPFDESVTNKPKTNIEPKLETKIVETEEPVTPDILEKQVDELYESFNKVAEKLDVPKLEIRKLNKRESSLESKEDDDDIESLEEVFDNDAGELLHLQQRAKEQNAASEQPHEEETESSSLAVKVVVGLALAFVARLVLVKKNLADKTTSGSGDESAADGEPASMRRRFTMIASDDTLPVDDEELLDEDLEEEYLDEEDEELDISEDEQNDGGEKVEIEKFEPETFEQLNAMYRPKGFENLNEESFKEEKPSTKEIIVPQKGIKPMEAQPSRSVEVKRDIVIPAREPPKFSAPPPPPLKSESLPLHSPQPIIFPPIPPAPAPSPVPPPPPASDEPKRWEGLPAPREWRQPDDEEYDDDLDNPADEEIDDDSYEEEEIEEEEGEDGADDDSDVDDADLLHRLEQKYGKLPEKSYDSEDEDVDDSTWTTIKPSKGGAQSFSEDAQIEEDLKRANDEMLQNNLQSALKLFESLAKKYPDVPGALYGKAKVLDRLAEKYRSNQILEQSIEALKRLLALEEKVDDDMFKEAAELCIERMRFKGMHDQAVAIHQMLIARFSDNPHYRNQLAVTYLLTNRLSDAKSVLHQTLLKWRTDGFALAHYGFVLKNRDNDLERAVKYLREGIESRANGTQDGRFFFNLGDALQRLGRQDEAIAIYRDGATKKLFLSEYQRSLYNVNGLKAQPFWTKKDTSYGKYFDVLEKNWELIREEGLAALDEKGFFVDEAESLRDVGDWKQFELFARGMKFAKNCQKAPITCKIIETFPAARFCKRGQVKFSVMHPGTHVWPHCGPSNCRIRAHLGLKVPPGTSIRVEKETRSWTEGKFLIFDDSFEHEVWHNGTSVRLVLIVDIWHPELTEEQKAELSPI